MTMTLMTAIIGTLAAVTGTLVVMLKHECAGLTRAKAVSTARARIANRTPSLGRRQTMLGYDERW
jgi:hypothetical protein